LSLADFEGSGADFPTRSKPYLHDANTIVTSPHKVYGASTNDLILQLRRYRIEKIILAGPVGNLCVEAHMRDFIEHGFEVVMVRDARAGTSNEEGDGYQAALVNWRFMAHALWSTAETVSLIERLQGQSLNLDVSGLALNNRSKRFGVSLEREMGSTPTGESVLRRGLTRSKARS
jgi:hypothetical protein